MKKPLIGAAAFALAALVFLIYSAARYGSDATAAEERKEAWEDTATLRMQLVQTKRELQQASIPDPPKGRVDVPGTLGELIKQCGIDTNQMKIDAAAAGANEQSRSSVRLTNVPIQAMGQLFRLIQSRHPYLTVREIKMQSVRDNPGSFTWSVQIAVPSAG